VKPVTGSVPTPLHLPSKSEPKAGFFRHLTNEKLYDGHTTNPFANTDTEGNDDTDIDEGGFESTRELLGSSEGIGQRYVFSGEERRREGDFAGNSITWEPGYGGIGHSIEQGQREHSRAEKAAEEGAEEEAGSEESRHQAELRRRALSLQRQKRVCEAHGCRTEVCRINHVARKKVESFMEGLDERTGKLHEPVEKELAPAPTDDSATDAAEKPLSNLTEIAESCESQFDMLFRDIEPGNWKNWDW
jgi:hypothetical protein